MPCYHPLKGFRSPQGITFNRQRGFVDKPLQVPCGQCIGCRLERSRQWALRCMHEASLYPLNCFLTLTYSEEHLPANSSLDMRHFQLFMKKLRKRHPSQPVRFFHCGEYGETTNRPHYHAILFNFDFIDKTHYSTDQQGHRIYTSETLDKMWGLGGCKIGSVTFESAAYVARYCVKKITGKSAEAHYQGRKPEYATMSRRPGIGTGWYEKFSVEVFPSDFVVRNGVKMRPPKAYDRILERNDPKRLARIKGVRVRNAAKHAEDNTPARLRDREEVQASKLKTLRRNLE